MLIVFRALLCITLWAFVALPVSTLAHAAPAQLAPAKNVPTRILADKMTYLADKQQVLFEDKVHVIRPDFEMWSEKLTVYLKPAPAKQANQVGPSTGGLPEGMAAGDVDRIVAEKNVRMKRDVREGTSSKATYTVDTGVLVMEGNPRLTDGESMIMGDVIKYYTEQNRSEVTSTKGKQVEASFPSNKSPTRAGTSGQDTDSLSRAATPSKTQPAKATRSKPTSPKTARSKSAPSTQGAR